MNIQQLEFIIRSTFTNLDYSFLDQLDKDSYYSDQDKYELINRIEFQIHSLKTAGYNKLLCKQSRCFLCYPNADALSFHCPNTDELVIKYVFQNLGKTEEGEFLYRVEECKNNPIKEGANGLPF
ncbi:hypothetical protein [Zeaxanthinibacter enoshimensis]|uniref:Uncharacterized protein n=1 Tax=Zeaxanthinibacter enoshimensis TaxID=392009 RepID=A0A4R6TP46_9FLAO|nr:hypothetical protein [Zeaxanthinibacter enoshimensis]TDQ33372.1 hypothetical protein CLV82_1211 [Zeaxanthinibacter enoshimensis]